MGDISWDLLDPGTDLAAEAIRSLFPVVSGTSDIGPASTVLSNMLGVMSGICCTVMLGMVVYAVIGRVIHAGERGEYRDGDTSWWTPMRVMFAAVMLFPWASGFNSGQLSVSQIGLAGIGLASHLAKAAIQQIGPQAVSIATPLIPGTKRTVSALIQNEFCRALVNAAAGNQQLIPVPRPVQGSNQSGDGYVTWSYDLSQGNATGAPVCGSVTVHVASGTTQSGGVADVSGAQRDALQSTLESVIRPAVTSAAQALWTTRRASSLNGLFSLMPAASSAYTAKLQAAGTSMTGDLRSQFTADRMRQGAGGNADTMRMTEAGFFGLGAYYMELARLNGYNWTLLSAMPEVTPPSYQGLGRYLSSDLASPIAAARQFGASIDAYVATSDPLDAPTGGADLFSGAAPESTGAGVLETVLRKMDFSEAVLRRFVTVLAPSQTAWQDPFGGLMRLGNDLASVSLVALGAAAVLSSTTAATGIAAFNALTFNFAGAAATVTGSLVMNFLATPVFYFLMALLVPGLILAFVVPMIPMIMWTMGILGFFVRLFEAIIAVPLWMLAHLTIGGEGLHGRGIRGWGHVASLFLTPPLMVVGMFGSYWLFAFISRLIFLSFTIAASSTLAHGWLVGNLAGMVVLIAMFVLLHIIAEIQCFRLMTLVSSHAPTWLGIEVNDRMDVGQLTQDASLIGMGATLAAIRGGALSIAPRKPGENASTGGKDVLAPPQQHIGMDRAVASATDPGPVANRPIGGQET